MIKRNKEYINSVKEAIHGPRYKGYPIYGKVNTDDKRNKSENGMLSNIEWVNYTQKINTSPNNIRYVFIGTHQVVIVHYNKINGMKSKTRAVKTEALTDRLTVEELELLMGSVSSQWVCGNLEELYIDRAVYKDVAQGKNENISDNELRLVNHCFIKANTRETTMGNVEIKNRFPRLRAVGVLADFNETVPKILQSKADKIEELCDGDKSLSKVNVLKSVWNDANISLAEIIESNVEFGRAIKYRHQPSSEYVLRQGDYIFDSKLSYLMVLANSVKDAKLNSKIAEISEKYDKKEGQHKEELELEEYLNGLERRDANAVKLAFYNLTQEDIDDMLDKFSTAGKEHYKVLLGMAVN